MVLSTHRRAVQRILQLGGVLPDSDVFNAVPPNLR
jgi:hypothetical protein